MRVRKLRAHLAKLDKLLALHEERTIEQTLDWLIVASETSRGIEKSAKPKVVSTTDFASLNRKIRRMKTEREVVKTLVELEKDELVSFGRFVDVKVDKRENKVAIANTIIKHLGLRRLNQMISERNLD